MNNVYETPAICRAAARGRNDQLSLIIQAGADVNAVMECDTPLNLAVFNKRGHADKCIRILLKAGARINVRIGDHRNALSRYLYVQIETPSGSRYIPEKRAASSGDIYLLLYAAGETVSAEALVALESSRHKLTIPEFFATRGR